MIRVVVAAGLMVASIGTADAAVFTFSYATQSGIVAGGTINATDLGGFYSVDDVSGTRDGVAITGYDFFDPTAQSFTFSGGQPGDVDFSYYIGTDNYEIRWPGNGSSFGTEFLTDANGAVSSLLVTRFTLAPAAVPEAASWAMMVAGFGMISAATRRRRARVSFG